MTVAVVCFGNVLRGDDGFGVLVAHHLLDGPLPPGLRVVEVGIGGIHMVHELLVPVDALVVVDAAELHRAPGTVAVLRPEVVDVHAMTPDQRRDQLADMHYATPQRALMLAGALGVLPETVLMVACQPSPGGHELGAAPSPPVAAAVAPAAAEVRRLVAELGVEWCTTAAWGEPPP